MNQDSALLPIIVFSHLRWDFVFQRPQHIFSRLASEHRILFIEEPVHHSCAPSPFWERVETGANILVCRPRTPIAEPGFCDAQLPVLGEMLAELLHDEDIDDHIAWFYTPLAVPLLAHLRPRAVVYDCMDELSAFAGAPKQLPAREQALLEVADVVFTGGPSLYRARRSRHPNVHCFPSSVDVAHFARARADSDEYDAAEQASLPRPRLGFYGVIDERMDLDIVDALAGSRPDWQIVLVGPVVKIDESMLPRRPNLFYPGQQPYERLPEYLAGWDVCLLPFARNQATRYISPTKILEYMATERPIVSTPITDIAEPYGDIVYLAQTPDHFIAACERALNEDVRERAHRIGRMREVLINTSWDRTVMAMADEVIKAIRSKSPRPLASARAALSMASSATSGTGPDAARPPATATPPVVVIGAGPTGLSAAHELGADALLIEQNSRVGGWCRSTADRGFTFDYAGHIMFSQDPYVHELYAKLLGDNVHWQDREAWIYSKRVYTRYPFQGALYGLPPAVIKECIVGAIEARFGSLKDAHDPPEAGAGIRRLASAPSSPVERISDCCADGVLESTAELGARPPLPSVVPPGMPSVVPRGLVAQATTAPAATAGADRTCRGPRDFEEFIYRTWGRGIARHFAIPYNRKLWGVPLSEMETSWLGNRVPMPDLEDMIEGALEPVPRPMGPNARFGYPLRGGFQALMDGFLPHLRGPLRLNSRVSRVSPQRHTITIGDQEEIPYRYLISTMPLPVLIRMIGDEAPAAVQEAAGRLRSVSVRCVNIGVGRAGITDKHWIYFPEDTVFHRIFVQGNASPECNPPGGFGLTCEITYSAAKPLPCDGEALIRRCIDDCRQVGLLTPDDPIWTANQLDLPYAYVVYDHARERSVATIRQWLADRDIILAGRYSEWEYYNSDHAFIAGRKAATDVRQLLLAQRSRSQNAAMRA